jgi:hypothetical protein
MKAQATRTIFACCALAACALSAGCQLGISDTRTAYAEVLPKFDDDRETQRNWELTNAAWVEHTRNGRKYTTDYAQGFKEGLLEYLHSGGTAVAPVLPPKRYQSPHYENPQGAQSIRDWYAGFRRGAAVAASGYNSDADASPNGTNQPALRDLPRANVNEHPDQATPAQAIPGYLPFPQLDKKEAGQKNPAPEVRDWSSKKEHSEFEVLPPLRVALLLMEVAAGEPEEIESFTPPCELPQPTNGFGPRKKIWPPRANFLEVIILYQAVDSELTALSGHGAMER